MSKAQVEKIARDARVEVLSNVVSILREHFIKHANDNSETALSQPGLCVFGKMLSDFEEQLEQAKQEQEQHANDALDPDVGPSLIEWAVNHINEINERYKQTPE